MPRIAVAPVPALARIAILLPSRNRPDYLRKSIASLLDNATHPERVEIMLRFDDDDPSLAEEVNDCKNYRVYIGPRLGYRRIFEHFNEMCRDSRADWLMMWNDDTEILTKGWDELICQAPPHVVQFLRRDIFDDADTTLPVTGLSVFDAMGGHLSLQTHADEWIGNVAKDSGVLLRRNDIVFHHHRLQDETGRERDMNYDTDGFSTPEMRALRKVEADKVRAAGSTYWKDHDPPVSFIPEKWTYEQKRKFRYEMVNYLQKKVRFEEYKGEKVLCIGDGGGIDAVEFARHGAKVTVLDLSHKAIDITKKLFKEAKQLHAGLHVGDASALNFENESFDVVYTLGVLHHIPEVGKAVSEIARVLKPKGELLGMVYNKDSLMYAYSILLRAKKEGITEDEAMRKYSERNPGCPYSKAYTSLELQVLLNENGFIVDKIDVVYPVIDFPEKRKVFVQGADELGWHLFFRAIRA